MNRDNMTSVEEAELERLLGSVVSGADPLPSSSGPTPAVIVPAPESIGGSEVGISRMVSAPYQFPDRAAIAKITAAVTLVSDREILQKLRALRDTMVAMQPDDRDFLMTRDESCGLNVVLNERLTIAPAFRPYRSAQRPGIANRPLSDRWLIGDRTVIDLHWHWKKGVSPSDDLRSLFDSPDFSFEHAAELARRRWKIQTKADAVGLSEVDQLLGTVIRGEQARERWKTIVSRRKALRRRLLDLSSHPRYRLTPEAIEGLEHAACALLVARGSALIASTVIVHVGGHEMDAAKLRDVKKKLGRLGCVPGGWGSRLGT